VNDDSPTRSSPISDASEALAHALRRVLAERNQARRKLASKPVHDLRVALRRTRSLAEGFSELDSYAGWPHLRKACKRLQKCLAELRDIQVMSEWMRRLHFDEQPSGAAFVDMLAPDERRSRDNASAALRDFPRKRWKQWRRELPDRARVLPFHDRHFAAIALRRLNDVAELDRRRRRSPSHVAYHRLRIALKRFRYTLESFLPAQSAAWSPTLKLLQSRLGDVHDLDILRSRILKFGRENALLPSVQTPQLEVIERIREERIDRCDKVISRRPRSGGSHAHRPSLWDRWRRELDVLSGITLPESEGPSRSATRRVSLSVAKRIPPPNRRLRLS
jgi:CHAD domain-containing protein